MQEDCFCQERFHGDLSTKKICRAKKALDEQFTELRETLQQERGDAITEVTQNDDVRSPPIDEEAKDLSFNKG
ncbi:unnamed protein product [Haemonchus placei]|uniref:CACTA en-spm transposon protein n=1 Tax=Haemonchus placei TaxID=6290 RepID=A0A0N4WNC3_HAEPC|nr:unnamed protein product [Haemonchus placei]